MWYAPIWRETCPHGEQGTAPSGLRVPKQRPGFERCHERPPFARAKKATAVRACQPPFPRATSDRGSRAPKKQQPRSPSAKNATAVGEPKATAVPGAKTSDPGSRAAAKGEPYLATREQMQQQQPQLEAARPTRLRAAAHAEPQLHEDDRLAERAAAVARQRAMHCLESRPVVALESQQVVVRRRWRAARPVAIRPSAATRRARAVGAAQVGTARVQLRGRERVDREGWDDAHLRRVGERARREWTAPKSRARLRVREGWRHALREGWRRALRQVVAGGRWAKSAGRGRAVIRRRRPCGDAAAAVRRWCGDGAAMVRRPCGGRAAAVRLAPATLRARHHRRRSRRAAAAGSRASRSAA
eukprot:6935865-Prymnesium_polylepis.1